MRNRLDDTTAIRSLAVLPAQREEIELHTADGLTLVGELALPAHRPPAATLHAAGSTRQHAAMLPATSADTEDQLDHQLVRALVPGSLRAFEHVGEVLAPQGAQFAG